jgi:tRNA1(Val) A37 N6-methylase TrmN6
VLLFTAWRFPAARAIGIEAQPLSAELAARSLAWNGVETRCEIRLGDLRDPALVPEGASFDLVTGTPPYFPIGTGLQSDHVQRAPCRFEHRGGVEAYCLAGARLLAPGARFVACEAAAQAERVRASARAAQLRIERWIDVVPREGKAPLLSVFSLCADDGSGDARADAPLTIRGRDGRWTDAFRALRRDMGLPPGTDKQP